MHIHMQVYIHIYIYMYVMVEVAMRNVLDKLCRDYKIHKAGSEDVSIFHYSHQNADVIVLMCFHLRKIRKQKVTEHKYSLSFLVLVLRGGRGERARGEERRVGPFPWARVGHFLWALVGPFPRTLVEPFPWALVGRFLLAIFRPFP